MSTNLLFFGIYPYVALLICLVGSWARFDLSQYTWKAGSSQMLSKKGMRVYSNLFHVGVLFILAGHFVGLLTPASVYHHLISTENKQLLAMVSGGFFGVLCFIGLSGLILRRLTDARVRATGNASDLMILLVLYAQLILGLSTIVASTHHMDGSVMVMLADWAQAIVTLRPLAAAEAIAPVGLVYKLHVGLGLTLFVLFPFTRLVHIYHPADSYALALEAACRALIVRQLLLQRADALGIEARCEDGETPEEARIRQLLEEEVQVPEADEDACRTWYAANPGRLLGPWRLQLRHVLLACAPDDLEGRETARKQAAELLDELRGHPERFVDLARRFSACPSKEAGGDLGWIEPGQTVPEFEKRLLRRAPGLLEHPLESRYGLHVVELLGREGGEPLDFDAARAQIAAHLQAQVLQRAVGQYIGVLAGDACIEGFAFGGADGALVQ